MLFALLSVRVAEIFVPVGKFQQDLRSLSASEISWQPPLSFISAGIVLNITPLPCLVCSSLLSGHCLDIHVMYFVINLYGGNTMISLQVAVHTCTIARESYACDLLDDHLFYPL